MTRHPNLQECLGGSPAGLVFSRLCTLTLAAILLTGGAAAGLGQVQSQAQPDTAKPAKPAVEKSVAAEPAPTISHGYMVHQSLDVGGRYTTVTGSAPMWSTLFNMGSGARLLGQSLEMRSVDTSKTPLFDSLSTYSNGYGGDPLNVTRLKLSKGRLYDFSGSFRRDRQYFDYNLLDNSLLTTYTATAPVLVNEPDSLHLFNTVRRNTDTNLTILPLSFISFRAAYNHGTMEGPTYSTVHNGGDVQVLNWFRNGSDTYDGGVDLKLAKRTTLSYDQLFVFYKGDSSYQLAGANYALNGSPSTFVSLGVDVLGGATTCGSATTTITTAGKALGTPLPLEVSAAGIASQYCTGTIVQSQATPIRTHFPTEQMRFNTHYWDKLSMNARVLYSGATSTIDSFSEVFNGLGRGNVRQTIETGNGPGGQFADNKRINATGDFGLVAELSKYFSVSDTFSAWNTRTEGYSSYVTQTWTGVAGTAANVKTGAAAIPTTTMLTPLSDPTITVTSPAAISSMAGNVAGLPFLNQKVEQNIAIATATILPEFKLSGGWRFKSREINELHATNLTWHENGAILGAVIQPSPMVRVNINFDSMDSKYSSGTAVLAEPATPLTLLPSNTFTRIAPDKSYRIKARATVKPAKWINFAVTGNDYSAKNDDPQVNHVEHNQDVSLAASIMPMEGLSLDFNYAHDDVFAETDLCYIFASNANAPLSAGAVGSTATCAQSATNPEGTLSTASAASQLYLGTGRYNSPSNFISGSLNYSPSKYWRLNGGMRLNDVKGDAEMLNPLMVPGALQSKMVTPFADLEVRIAPQWVWHGNWVHDEYDETGLQSATIPSRNTRGNVLTLGVKYAF